MFPPSTTAKSCRLHRESMDSNLLVTHYHEKSDKPNLLCGSASTLSVVHLLFPTHTAQGGTGEQHSPSRAPKPPRTGSIANLPPVPAMLPMTSGPAITPGYICQIRSTRDTMSPALSVLRHACERQYSRRYCIQRGAQPTNVTSKAPFAFRVVRGRASGACMAGPCMAELGRASWRTLAGMRTGASMSIFATTPPGE